MPHVPLFVREGLVRHGIRGKMSQIPVGKRPFRPGFRLVQEFETNVPGVRGLVVGEILFAEDDVGHEIAVEKVLLVFPQKREDPGGDQRRIGEEFIAEVHMGQRTPCEGKGRDQYESGCKEDKEHNDFLPNDTTRENCETVNTC